jgi:hypothetical protein
VVGGRKNCTRIWGRGGGILGNTTGKSILFEEFNPVNLNISTVVSIFYEEVDVVNLNITSRLSNDSWELIHCK